MKKSVILTLLIASAAYVGLYLIMTVQGHYEPSVLGWMEGPDGKAWVVPKAAFGYQWWPFRRLTAESKPVICTIAFLPLLCCDRNCWHTPDKAETFRYRVKNYFDFDAWEYRDIEPTSPENVQAHRRPQ